MKTINAIRGMKDISPAETPDWQHVEDAARRVLDAYGYREVRPPLVESTELFRRSVGEGTDIVEKEMYTFPDRNGESLTLRPECTASCVRAAIEHSWLRGQGQRLWHIGPMFRYEKPQRGRYRQFHQLDVEALGYAGPDVDVELILLGARLWHELGVTGLALEINSLGSRETQATYRERLVAYFEEHRENLDDDSLRRLGTNPLRILDSKNSDMQAMLNAAPSIIDCLDPASKEHFDQLREMLSAAGIEFRINARLVRGLDYYTRTVFEWTTDQLGSQNAVCGGGRYDGLIAEIGGPPTPAIGFALGLERLVALLQGQSLCPSAPLPHAYLLAVGRSAQLAAHPMAERLRDRLPQLRLIVDADDSGFKRKLKRADRSAATLALILGEDEMRDDKVSVKDLRSDEGQRTVTQSEIDDFLRRRFEVADSCQ